MQTSSFVQLVLMGITLVLIFLSNWYVFMIQKTIAEFALVWLPQFKLRREGKSQAERKLRLDLHVANTEGLLLSFTALSPRPLRTPFSLLCSALAIPIFCCN